MTKEEELGLEISEGEPGTILTVRSEGPQALRGLESETVEGQPDAKL